MSKLVPKNPHDEFFKAIFSKPENTAMFLKHYLPAEVVKALDLDTLKLQKDSLMGKELRSYYSDLLFTVKAGTREGFVHILFEHKSYRDQWLPLQLLRYMVRLFDRYVREHKGARGLPFVVPVVLYHGTSKDVPQSLGSLFDPGNEAFLRYVPDFQYALANLTAEQDDGLRGLGMLRGAMLVMKHIRDADLLNYAPGLMDLLWQMHDADTGIEAMMLYIQYIAAGAVNVDQDELLKILEEKGGEVMPSLAKKLYDQGLEQGLEKGREEGLEKGMEKGLQWMKAVIADLLEVRYGADGLQIAKSMQSINDLNTLQAVRLAVKAGEPVEQVRAIIKKAVG